MLKQDSVDLLESFIMGGGENKKKILTFLDPADIIYTVDVWSSPAVVA